MIPTFWQYENAFKIRVERLQKISKKSKWKKSRK